MKEKRKKAPATPESAAGKPVAAKTMPGSGAQNPRADGVRITAEMLAASAPVAIAATVVQQMHRHARSQMGAEVCGVLIGEEAGGTTVIEAAIAGEGAAQGGAHVTFTQDTWEHIYSVKDRDYPEKRIVGWYHSHPGFGIFLSQQDLFIHENFFSSPAQVAWVYDPHSDEEGCFGWVDGKVKRLREVRVIEAGADDAPVVGEEPDEVPGERSQGRHRQSMVRAKPKLRSGSRRWLAGCYCCLHWEWFSWLALQGECCSSLARLFSTRRRMAACSAPRRQGERVNRKARTARAKQASPAGAPSPGAKDGTVERAPREEPLTMLARETA
ncbi:MAG: Mov34/MPN/PAD-1 family protein [Bryobacterales bacterium]|nr:Mov34/MPN/PAD-1 family protein [Bryobacterales bacterium]